MRSRPAGALLRTAATESAASSAAAGTAPLQATRARPLNTRASLCWLAMGGSTDSADAAGTAAAQRSPFLASADSRHTPLPCQETDRSAQ